VDCCCGSWPTGPTRPRSPPTCLATANTVTDTHLGTTGQRLHRASVTVSNLDSLAANDDLWVRIARDANNASDTMTGDAILVLATVSYSDT